MTCRKAPIADAPEVAGGLLEVRVQPDRPGADDDRDVRHAERDVGDRDLGERPLAAEHLAKKSSRLMPMTISGVTIGSSRSSLRSAPRQRKPIRASAETEQRARATVDAMTAMTATWRVTPSAPRRSLVGEQRRVPVEREAGPVEVPRDGVEAEDDQDDDRQRTGRRRSTSGVGGQPAVPLACASERPPGPQAADRERTCR